MATPLDEVIAFAVRSATACRGHGRPERYRAHLAVVEHLRRLQALEAAVAAQPAGVREALAAAVTGEKREG